MKCTITPYFRQRNRPFITTNIFVVIWLASMRPYTMWAVPGILLDLLFKYVFFWYTSLYIKLYLTKFSEKESLVKKNVLHTYSLIYLLLTNTAYANYWAWLLHTIRIKCCTTNCFFFDTVFRDLLMFSHIHKTCPKFNNITIRHWLPVETGKSGVTV